MDDGITRPCCEVARLFGAAEDAMIALALGLHGVDEGQAAWCREMLGRLQAGRVAVAGEEPAVEMPGADWLERQALAAGATPASGREPDRDRGRAPRGRRHTGRVGVSRVLPSAPFTTRMPAVRPPAQTPLRTEDVVRLLREACAEAGSQSAWAVAHDLSAAYVSDVLRGRREPGDGVLAALGLERVVTYWPVESGERERNDIGLSFRPRT